METIANLASWFQATNVSAIVRIHKSFAHLIPGILDQGISDGIQVSEGHRQLGICRLTESAMGWAMPGDTRDYAAMATPVTSAQVAKAWVRPDPRFAAVSWSRRRGKTLAT